MQNLVLVIELQDAYNLHETPLKGGNMILNRLCIDEDAAFELSGVYYFDRRRWYYDMMFPEKGKEFSFSRFIFILIN